MDVPDKSYKLNEIGLEREIGGESGFWTGVQRPGV
jgi:hypothetical protein